LPVEEKFMICMKDIADRVGVSTTTVSNVLHGKAQRVSSGTRKKFEDAVDKGKSKLSND